MFATIITDCKSPNSVGRQETRLNALGLGPTATIGVNSELGINSTIEVAGNLIDVLDAAERKRGVVIINVAPRGKTKKDVNGSPFCYFYYQDTLVISTIRDYTLSLVKKFELVKNVSLLEIEKVLDFATDKKLVTKKLNNFISKSQFRSFDVIPHLAKWLFKGAEIPSQKYRLKEINDDPSCIWGIDAFGNAKTTLTLKDLIKNNKSRPKIETNLGTLPFYEGLKDIPYGETAIYIGSSGIENHRFLEIATQGKKGGVAKSLNLKVGLKIQIL